MNRLTFKQRGLIRASPCIVQPARHGRDVRQSACQPRTPMIVNTRKGFTSDRALEHPGNAISRCEGKHAQTTPRALLTEQGFMMHLTIAAADVTELRHRVIGACGELVLYMRIQPLQHASKMRIWILLRRQEFDFVRRVIQSGIPDADFVDAQ